VSQSVRKWIRKQRKAYDRSGQSLGDTEAWLKRRQERWREILAEIVPGRTVIDIGGMWFLHGNVSFWAEELGASSVVLLDGMDPTPEFEAEHRRRGSDVQYMQGDLHERATMEMVGPHDIVWCTGVLYHTPDPYRQFEHLRLICRERCFVGTQTIPELPDFENAAVFYPFMSDESRLAHDTAHPGGQRVGVSEPFDMKPMMGYANWWWGLSPSCLTALMQSAGFEILDVMAPQFTVRDVLAAPTDAAAVTPPPDFARQRHLDRLASIPEAERPPWLRRAPQSP